MLTKRSLPIFDTLVVRVLQRRKLILQGHATLSAYCGFKVNAVMSSVMSFFVVLVFGNILATTLLASSMVLILGWRDALLNNIQGLLDSPL